MKPTYLILTFILFMFSWQKVSHNGNLDGRWQLMTIEKNDGSIENPVQIYYSIQLNLINLTHAHGVYLIGYFHHMGDSLHICMRETNKQTVALFGLNDTLQSFAIEQLTKKRMILRSSSNRLLFRKF
ncbi:MAG: lipocalin-like domain-containing protein [Bacteroidales bacterium]|nr:lipocalin-like domain-containing protein [Bacteroidales bacterium]